MVKRIINITKHFSKNVFVFKETLFSVFFFSIFRHDEIYYFSSVFMASQDRETELFWAYIGKFGDKSFWIKIMMRDLLYTRYVCEETEKTNNKTILEDEFHVVFSPRLFGCSRFTP